MKHDFMASNSNMTPFEDTYLKALRHILHGREEAACGALNHVGRMLKNIKADDENGNDLFIARDLANCTFESLYGDYKSNSSYPWIRNQKTLSIIASHIDILGDEEDKQACNNFLIRTAKAYEQPVAPLLKLAI